MKNKACCYIVAYSFYKTFKKLIFYNIKSDLLPALKGEGSLRSRGLHPFNGCYSVMVYDKRQRFLYC